MSVPLPAAPATAAAPPPVALRPEQPGDEAFLFELYASTRQEELEAWGWPEPMRADFLRMQFAVQQGYRTEFPRADFELILLGGQRVGRWIVDRAPHEIRLVDIALLAGHRNAGAGTRLLRQLQAEAEATRKPLRLTVLKGHRAARLYQRLGFVRTGGTELHDEMEWRGGGPPANRLTSVRASLKLPQTFDPARLQEDLRRVLAEEFVPHFNTAYYQGDWSVVPFRSVGGRANHIYPDPTAKTAYADTPLLSRCPYIREVLAAFPCPQQAVRFLRLKAGSVIKEHTDYNLGYEDGEVRLHIPVVTNPGVEFVLNGTRVDMQAGECWYHDFNLPHRVANRGSTDRVHLVIDCELNDWLRGQLLKADAAPVVA